MHFQVVRRIAEQEFTYHEKLRAMLDSCSPIHGSLELKDLSGGRSMPEEPQVQVVSAIDLLAAYIKAEVPSPGGVLRLSSPFDVLGLGSKYMRPIAHEQPTLLRGWAIVHLFRRLSVDNVLRVLQMILLETKIIFVSKSLQQLSASTMAIIPLLHPLRWAGLFIPVLPLKLKEFLDAPVPYIVGVQSMLPGHKMPDVAVVNIDSGQLVPPSDGFSRSLPLYDELCEQLTPLHMAIQSLALPDHDLFHHVPSEATKVCDVTHNYLKMLLGAATVTARSDFVNPFNGMARLQLAPGTEGFVRQFVTTSLFKAYDSSSEL
jgi:hypothetical protein